MASRLQIPSDYSVLLSVTHSNLKNFASDVRFSVQRTNLSSSVRGETEDHYHPLVFAVRCRNQSSGFQDRSYCAIAEDVGFL
ncbi:hypothetical protein MRB53_013168 [Persea americana]|uniref:Uncharacterized protein n=1 Tax=Persea americana TaxID=3435 RepID=A0ACC2K7L7_PERAE|nr:hypothetical protein MRB53_013168 [Persea americana]